MGYKGDMQDYRELLRGRGTDSPEEGRQTTYEYVIKVMEGARCVREIPGAITIKTPNIDDFIRGVFKFAPTIKSAPPADGVERIWGMPLQESPGIPKNHALMGTPCGCSLPEIMADGGALYHMAKRHCVLIKFGDNANEDNNPENPAPPAE